MGGKKGGGQRTPHIAPNTLESKQKINLIHLLCAGTISGWQQDSLLKSIRFNDTRVQNSDDSFNFNNVRVNWLAGDLEQDYLVGFDGIERTSSVGAQVTKRTPITRTITDPLVGSSRITLGVNSLFRQTDQGDMYGTHVDLSIQTIKNNQIHSSVIWSLNEKGNTAFKQDAVLTDLPEAPFDLKIVRLTNDSTSDKLKNDTMFHSYVEVIPQKFSYPTCAVVGIELDAEQLGGQVPIINYEILGREVQVPTNYDPVTRKYTGLWDGSFKSAYTNNIAWIVYDFMTDSVHGLGRYFNQTIIDKMRLYEIGRYADVMVDNGDGGEEPRYVFNGLIQGNDATTILHNLCSVFRGRPVEKNGFISFIYDKGNENPVYTYTNANVIDGVFNYTHAPLDTRINSVQYEYADERDGCKIKVEEISNHKSIAKYNRINTEKITCYGQTRRSAALRHAKWFLETAETETESVDFIVGFQGIKHGAFDIVAIADNNKAGIPIGGRILSTDGNVVTLDREVVGAKEIRIRKDLYTVKDRIGGDKYRLDRVIDAKPYDVFSANTDRATERLFKVISTEENEDGSYTISAVKYNAQKQSVVDSSVSQYPEIETSLNPAPVLTDGNIANQGDYLLLTWDSLASVGTEVTYNVQIFKDNKHYQTHTTKEPMLKLYNLPMGEYYAKIKGRTNTGGYSQELIIPFSTTYNIHNLVTKSEVFGFDMSWQNPPLITTNSKVEVWASDDDKAFNKIATLAYPQDAHSIRNLSIGDELYVKVRIVDDMLNYGEFTDSVMGKPSQDSEQIKSYLEGQITTKELSGEVVSDLISEALAEIKLDESFREEIINDAINDIQENVDQIISESELIESINKKIGDAELEQRLLELSKSSGDGAIFAETQINRLSIDNAYSEIILQKVSQATSDKQLASQYLSLLVENERAKAELMLAQIAQTTDSKALVQEISSLTASFLLNTASIDSLKEATATEFDAQAQSIEKIKTDVKGNTASIDSVKKTTSDLSSSTAQSFEKVSAEIDNSIAESLLANKSKATSDGAFSQDIASLSAGFLLNTASIDSLKETTATEFKATAKELSKLEVSTAKNSAAIMQNSTSIATTEGYVNSQYTLTTETTINGEKYVSGFTSKQDGKTSEFVVQADKFAIVNKKNGEMQMPFIIASNKMFFNGDMIATGSISGDKLVANTSIKAPIIKGGRIESGHIAGGQLNIGNGNCTISQNGDFYAKNGRFEGTVYANKIEGDVITISTFRRATEASEHQFVIPPENFNRLLIIENIEMYGLRMGQNQLKGVVVNLYFNETRIFTENDNGSGTIEIPKIQRSVRAGDSILVRITITGGWENSQHLNGFGKVRNGLVTSSKTRTL